jgi:exopolysaccharide production protein ExoZ
MIGSHYEKRDRPMELVSIQYLRGFAACAVLVGHAGNFEVGSAGVDLFFVISGFIMWVVSHARSLGPVGFMVRRIARIVPLYWGVTLGTAAVAVLVPGAFPNLRVTPGNVLSSIFFVPHRDPSGHIYPLIVPGWSLNYEMFFYAIFAIVLAFSARLRLPLVAMILVALVTARSAFVSDSALWVTYTDPILLEFLAGVLLGAAYTTQRRLSIPASLLLIAIGFTGFAATIMLGLRADSWRAVHWGIPALLIVAGMVFCERSGKMTHWRLPHFIGDASYSLYLVHMFAVALVFRSLGRLHLPDALEIGVAVVVSIGVGMVVYVVIERPLLRISKYKGGRRTAMESVLAVTPTP